MCGGVDAAGPAGDDLRAGASEVLAHAARDLQAFLVGLARSDHRDAPRLSLEMSPQIEQRRRVVDLAQLQRIVIVAEKQYPGAGLPGRLERPESELPQIRSLGQISASAGAELENVRPFKNRLRSALRRPLQSLEFRSDAPQAGSTQPRHCRQRASGHDFGPHLKCVLLHRRRMHRKTPRSPKPPA